MSKDIIILDDFRKNEDDECIIEVSETEGERKRKIRRYLLFIGVGAMDRSAWDNLRCSKDTLEECLEVVADYGWTNDDFWWEVIDLDQGCIVRRD